MKRVKIIGGGLAGCEAALQLADRGYVVDLFEMRPEIKTPAHKSSFLAELVCSNSFKSQATTTGSGLLKAELELLGCKLLPLAKKCKVPAGSSLSVDRKKFAQLVTQQIEQNPNIKIYRQEVKSLDSSIPTILATGPLTSSALTLELQRVLKQTNLFFFDAIAPIVDVDSIDTQVVFRKSRYDKGSADYLNCPFTKEEYLAFVEALRSGGKYKTKDFETQYFKSSNFKFYENCIPIEELARRGENTLRFGVMRPVGLEVGGKRAYAVLQLRTENRDFSAFNLVGCQTMLRQGEQKRIFRTIPGLSKVKFLRFGSIHRNTYLNAPEVLTQNLSLCLLPNIFPAGQIMGVEGYCESIWGGLTVAKSISGEPIDYPQGTICGGLKKHLLENSKNFQPMNANFGLLPIGRFKIKNKKEKKRILSEFSLELSQKFCHTKS